MFIKICGITDLDGARAAVAAGADAVGFNFWRPGKRYVAPERAAEIAAQVPGTIMKVGVFVDEAVDQVKEIATQAGLNAIQLHGSETAEYAHSLAGWTRFKVFRVDDHFEAAQLDGYPAEAFLLDNAGATPGGTGAAFDWRLAIGAARYGRIIVAGGLHPDNVAEAVRALRPWGVDVAGGVESAPGRKDPALVERFVRAARSAEKEA